MQLATREDSAIAPAKRTLETAKRYLEIMDPAVWPDKIRGALYIQHGAKDALISASQAERLAKEAKQVSRLVLDVRPGGNHCGHNLYPRIALSDGRLPGGDAELMTSNWVAWSAQVHKIAQEIRPRNSRPG